MKASTQMTRYLLSLSTSPGDQYCVTSDNYIISQKLRFQSGFKTKTDVKNWIRWPSMPLTVMLMQCHHQFSNSGIAMFVVLCKDLHLILTSHQKQIVSFKIRLLRVYARLSKQGIGNFIYANWNWEINQWNWLLNLCRLWLGLVNVLCSPSSADLSAF